MPLIRLVIGHQLLDQVHVGAPLGQRDIDHLDAEELADGEMPVVAGHRAEKFDLVVFAPGFFGAEDSLEHGAGHTVVHHSQRGRTSDDDLVGGNPHDLSKQLFGRGNSGQLAVIAAVDPLVLAVGP